MIFSLLKMKVANHRAMELMVPRIGLALGVVTPSLLGRNSGEIEIAESMLVEFHWFLSSLRCRSCSIHTRVLYIYIHIHMYTHTYICIFILIHIYIYIYTYGGISSSNECLILQYIFTRGSQHPLIQQHFNVHVLTRLKILFWCTYLRPGSTIHHRELPFSPACLCAMITNGRRETGCFKVMLLPLVLHIRSWLFHHA